MASKRPIYFAEPQESDMYENTPKHVLYALARDLIAERYSIDLTTNQGAVYALAMMESRINVLKLNGLIR